MATAQEIALKYMTPRYIRLDKLEQYCDGTQYDGRAPFFSQEDGAPPLLERAPCVVYGIFKIAIRDLVDFMMGEGRYPHISTGATEDDKDLDDEGLSEEQASLLERWINGPLTESANLKHEFPEAMRMAMRGSSVALVACLRQGYPKLEALPAKWCKPVFNPATREVIALEVKYPYIVEEQNPISMQWEEVCYIYRRLITTEWDVVYLPAKGREDGIEPSWTADLAQTVQHNLGFCPVHWYAFERGAPTAADFDGKAIHQHLLDEADALNFSASQRHRAAVYSGDPQIWETGVEEGTMPAPLGRTARVEIEAQAAGPNGKPIGVYTSRPRGSGRGESRKKGPGIVWRYPEATSKVGMLTLGEGSLSAIAENSDDIRKKITEDLSVVLIDPADAKAFGALSGKALAFLFTRQIARADSIRLDAQPNLINPSIQLLLRLCFTIGRHNPASVRVLGFKKIVQILQKYATDSQLPDMTPDGAIMMATMTDWSGPRLRLQWGVYFETSAEEQNFTVALCVAAYQSQIIPIENILEKLRDVFPFASVEELMKKLEDAKAEAQKNQLTMQDQSGAIAAKHEQKSPGGSASGAKGDKKA